MGREIQHQDYYFQIFITKMQVKSKCPFICLLIIPAPLDNFLVLKIVFIFLSFLYHTFLIHSQISKTKTSFKKLFYFLVLILRTSLKRGQQNKELHRHRQKKAYFSKIKKQTVIKLALKIS